ncbi:MAG: hypothetical protein HY020_25175 [Burkholderiales bacterium]|nr:hypothetical protein [Burkholderiales bacterium]
MPIVLVDFNETSRQAFKRGVAKGMAAPLMLFASNQAHVDTLHAVKIPQVSPVRVPGALTALTDMERLGMDFNAALGKHEKEIGESTARGSKAG